MSASLILARMQFVVLQQREFIGVLWPAPSSVPSAPAFLYLLCPFFLSTANSYSTKMDISQVGQTRRQHLTGCSMLSNLSESESLVGGFTRTLPWDNSASKTLSCPAKGLSKPSNLLVLKATSFERDKEKLGAAIEVWGDQELLLTPAKTIGGDFSSQGPSGSVPSVVLDWKISWRKWKMSQVIEAFSCVIELTRLIDRYWSSQYVFYPEIVFFHLGCGWWLMHKVFHFDQIKFYMTHNGTEISMTSSIRSQTSACCFTQTADLWSGTWCDSWRMFVNETVLGIHVCFPTAQFADICMTKCLTHCSSGNLNSMFTN